MTSRNVLTATLIALAAAPALADDDCTAPMANWQPREAVHAMAEARKLAQDPRFAGLEFSTVESIVNNPAADGCPDIATFCISNGSIQLGKGEKADQLATTAKNGDNIRRGVMFAETA